MGATPALANTASPKIRPMAELAELLSSIRAQGKKVVHCHGVFDLMHIGHIRHFEQARRFGDVLVVTVTPDRFVNKGPNRPVFHEKLRAEAIASLACVDYVGINEWPTAVETIHLLRPDFYAKGSEFVGGEDLTGAITVERQAIEESGGQIAFTDDVVFSSSNLLNRHLPVLPDGVEAYLTRFCDRHPRSKEVLCYLENARALKVLVVGEAIIDEYQYCETLGKAGKEPILAVRQLNSEKFPGGVLAIGNHVASISEHVAVVSFIGSEESQEEFIREQLNARIETFFFRLPNAPSIVKRRFVEKYPFQKLFEVYVMGGVEDYAIQGAEFCDRLAGLVPQFDVVIAADFGHGMLSPEAIEILCRDARFLAVNTQVNAENHGFNTVSKYRRADFISVSENELRMETRSRRKDLRDILLAVSEKLRCGRFLITRGRQGSLCYSSDEGFQEVPALTNRVVDRIGAGDATLSVTALCAAQGAPIDIVGFVGNAAGALAVGTVGNSAAISSVQLCRYIDCLMK